MTQINDMTDMALVDMAAEYDLDLDNLYGEFEGIMADPSTKALDLTSKESAEYGLRLLRGECAEGRV